MSLLFCFYFGHIAKKKIIFVISIHQKGYPKLTNWVQDVKSVLMDQRGLTRTDNRKICSQNGQLKVGVTDVTKEILRSNPAKQYNVMIVLCFY